MCWPAKPEQFAKWKNGQIVEPEPEKKSPNVAAGLKGDPKLKLRIVDTQVLLPAGIPSHKEFKNKLNDAVLFRRLIPMISLVREANGQHRGVLGQVHIG